jgi:FixJ family two-component response regulator
MGTIIPIVYVVDDDESMRRALGKLVVSAGLTVQTFPSAQEYAQH